MRLRFAVVTLLVSACGAPSPRRAPPAASGTCHCGPAQCADHRELDIETIAGLSDSEIEWAVVCHTHDRLACSPDPSIERLPIMLRTIYSTYQFEVEATGSTIGLALSRHPEIAREARRVYAWLAPPIGELIDRAGSAPPEAQGQRDFDDELRRLIELHDPHAFRVRYIRGAVRDLVGAAAQHPCRRRETPRSRR